jgi:hypothetical protein
MTKDEALDLALERGVPSILSPGWVMIPEEAFATILQARALDKKAENARELGLDYEPDEWMTGCPECGIDSGCDCDSGTWNPPAQPAPVQPIGYVKLIDTPFGEKLKPVLTVAVPVGAKLYTTPPAAQRQRVVFPTMLRKMWSGGEVQKWLDETVNKENT